MYRERGQASNVMSQHPYNPNNLLMKRQVPWVITFKVTGALCTDSRKNNICRLVALNWSYITGMFAPAHDCKVYVINRPTHRYTYLIFIFVFSTIR